MDATMTRIADKIRVHGYSLNPVISIQEVEKFEVQNKILLPNEYRDFITQIGNGGDGPPFYGLFSLNESYDETKKGNREIDNFLSREFPLTEYWVWESEEHWTEEKKKKYNRVFNGNLILGTEGCGMYWTLIVSGPLRGQIWDIADVGAQPCAPSLSFLEWYEYWLDGGSDWWRDFAY
jgi:hypothetical protein